MPLLLQLATLSHFEILFTCQIQVASVYGVFFSVWGINVSMLGRETIDEGAKCYLSAIMVKIISK